MKVKICGIKTPDEIKIINDTKPDFIGFIFAKSKREISPETALNLKKGLSEGILTAGVFVDAPVDKIMAYHKKGAFDIAQLHGNYDENDIKALKSNGIQTIKVIRVKENLYRINTLADYLLFDSFSPVQSGGVNKTFDWNIKIEANVPYFIAGGINEENILTMAEKLKPFAADISSGVEVDGFKTKEKVSNIINIIRGINL